jgi:hypothetical protein
MEKINQFSKALNVILTTLLAATTPKKRKARTPKEKLRASRAAKKAWETRRTIYSSAELKNMHSAAAKKAWVTIRRNKENK